MTFLYQKSRCLIEAFSLHLKHLLLFLPTTMYEGSNKRVFVVNVQGITGKKVSYFSYPYSKVVTYGIETAGFMDIDSELLITMQNGIHLQFDFKSQVDIKAIISNIQKYIL